MAFSIRRSINYLQENKAKMFWLWILYQAVKGSLTLTLVWIPLFLLWKQNGGLTTFFPDWGGFILALLAFMLSHIIPLHPSIKTRLVSVMGSTPFWVIFNVLSLALFSILLWQALNAPRDVVWVYQDWHGNIGFMLSAAGITLIIAGLGIRNPFSILSSNKVFDPNKPGVLRVTRHPVLMGIAIWAIGHLIMNGTVSLVVFFAFNAIFALLGAILIDRKRKKADGIENWRKLSWNTSMFPNPLNIPKAIAESYAAGALFWLRFATWVCLLMLILWGHILILKVDPLLAIGAGL